MKIAIMQPYFMPYIGYFQLIDSCDVFVACDTVQYIKEGWINRNRLLINGAASKFTLSLKKAPREYKINQRYLSDRFKEEKDKLLRTIKINYAKAPYLSEVLDLLTEVLDYDSSVNIAEFNYNSLKKVCDYIGINKHFMMASDIVKDNELKRQDMVIDLVKRLDGDVYINAIGGTELYSKEVFKNNGIDLYFIKTNDIEYKQLKNKFEPNLSIIDVLMFNSKDQVKKLIKEYKLI